MSASIMAIWIALSSGALSLHFCIKGFHAITTTAIPVIHKARVPLSAETGSVTEFRNFRKNVK
jgi:hypothetical protein